MEKVDALSSVFIPYQRANFAEVFTSVIQELKDHPEVWIGQHSEPSAVLERMKKLGGPEMMLVHGKVVTTLGRVPRFGETDSNGQSYTVTLEHVVRTWEPHDGLKKFELTFLSHRSTTEPDEEGAIAKAIQEMSSYCAEVYHDDLYWWVDCACVDQDISVGGHVAYLPLYIAATSQMFSLYLGPEYDTRGWINAERAVFSALCSPRGWKYHPNFDPVLQSDKDEMWILHDPAQMALTNESDRPYIHLLGELARELWPLAYDVNWRSDTNVYSEWGYARDLVYGETEIFTWHMNHFLQEELDDGEDDGEDDDEMKAENAAAVESVVNETISQPILQQIEEGRASLSANTCVEAVDMSVVGDENETPVKEEGTL